MGWSSAGGKGVDYVVAKTFAEALNSLKKPLRDYLIQVVAKGKEPVFRGGEVAYIDAGIREWTESVRYADAVILIGGLGGTYETYSIATQEQKPVFPIASTGGDAWEAYNDILNHWPLRPVEGISQEAFRVALNHPLRSEGDAQNVARGLMELVKAKLLYQDEPRAEERRVVFISYSHRDRRWLEKLRVMLRPLETYRSINIWDDTEIEAGEKWAGKIKSAIDYTAVAVFLVSPNFLASPFIKKEEMEKFIALAEQKKVAILWIPVSAGRYDLTGLGELQAACDPGKPLDTLKPARQNIVMVDISKKIEAAIDKNA